MENEPTERTITLRAADGVYIPAIVTEPKVRPLANLLLLHGITTQKNEFADFFKRIAKILSAEGIRCLRFDFRGHGESRESSRSFTISSQLLDTITAVNWLETNKEEDSQIHLMGCSFGAPPAIFTSSLRSASIASLSLLCPVLDYEKTFLKPSTEWARSLFNASTLAAAWETGILKMNDFFFIDIKLILEMKLLKPHEWLRQTAIPTLLIHGEADSMVPVSLSEEYTRGLSNVQLLTIPRMEHGFTEEDDEVGDSDESQVNLNRIALEVLSLIRSLEKR